MHFTESVGLGSSQFWTDESFLQVPSGALVWSGWHLTHFKVTGSASAQNGGGNLQTLKVCSGTSTGKVGTGV